MTLRIGTRASALAMAQAGTIATRLGGELVPIVSDGDRTDASLAALGGSGVFAGTLRRALVAGEVDAVVHSFKDLPTEAFPGLEVAAIAARADARDALCTRDGVTLDDLPAGARVGTGSPRRRAQVLSRRPDLDVVDIRGNVDSRLGRISEDPEHQVDPERRLDAVILAAAGLERLGYSDRVSEYFTVDSWPTAPAQGALAIETRTGEASRVAKLDHKPTRMATLAERGVLAALEAGCAAPIGARAFIDDGMLFLTARVYRLDGSEYLTSSHAHYVSDADPIDLAHRVADELLRLGAATLAPLGR